jgi:hypothetical protein
LPSASSTPESTTTQPSAQAPYQHLFFDATNHLDVSGEVLAGVDLVAGASVQLEAVTSDGSTIRFEIWRAHTDGHMELVNAFHVESGFVLTTIDVPSDGRTFLRFPAPATPVQVVVHLGCERDGGRRCTVEMQPGEPCFVDRPCAEGLRCIPVDGTCDTFGQGGTCTMPTKDVACDGEVQASTCGCDGLTYASACLARVAGSGVRSAGACPAEAPPAIAEPIR